MQEQFLYSGKPKYIPQNKPNKKGCRNNLRRAVEPELGTNFEQKIMRVFWQPF